MESEKSIIFATCIFKQLQDAEHSFFSPFIVLQLHICENQDVVNKYVFQNHSLIIQRNDWTHNTTLDCFLCLFLQVKTTFVKSVSNIADQSAGNGGQHVYNGTGFPLLFLVTCVACLCSHTIKMSFSFVHLFLFLFYHSSCIFQTDLVLNKALQKCHWM